MFSAYMFMLDTVCRSVVCKVSCLMSLIKRQIFTWFTVPRKESEIGPGFSQTHIIFQYLLVAETVRKRNTSSSL